MNLLKQCKHVLEQNWKGSFTIPSPRLYPFQWNWDSGFVALGNLHYKPERSIIELESLFKGQWENGFLPHIIFHNEQKYSSYFPSADYWNSSISSYAPKDLKTSGITQPPVHGFVLEKIFENNIDKSRINNLFDKIVKYHNYLYETREYNNTGLVSIWHNWESGMDNSVWWDEILERIDIAKLENIQLFRKDIYEVDESNKTRPLDLDYKRYLFLVKKLLENKYVNVEVNYHFQVLDPVFNSILIESNASLIRIGKLLGNEVPFLQNKMETGIKSFSSILWNNVDFLYYPFDVLSQSQIKKHCSGCYVPIFAGIPSTDQVKELVRHWKNYNDIFLIPSCFPDQIGFEQKNYWRGPVWVNINWMIWKGLLQYEMYELAEQIRNSTINLVEKFGVYEYFNPFIKTDSKTGYGGKNFSWTAALIIDMLRSEKV